MSSVLVEMVIATGCRHLSDVAEMNTVTRGPESSPTSPHIAQDPFCSWTDHHVESRTVVVTRSPRKSDWERLSGRWELASKDPGPAIIKDSLLPKASIR